MRYHRIGQAQYDLGNTHVDVPTAHIIAPHAGVSVAYRWQLANGAVLQPAWRSVYRDADVNVNGYGLTQRFGRQWENELSMSVALAGVHIGYAKGNETGSRKSAGATVKMIW